MAIATLVGLILGIATAFFVEYLDTSVKSMDDIERQVGLPVLAVIPKGVPPLNRDVADSPHAEGYRILRTKIEFARKDDSMNTLTLISGGPGEGKSTTLFNLAWVCALSGMRTLVVDADLRRPTMHHILGAKNESGLADLLLGNPPLEQCLQPTPLENLHFMPSGENAVKAIGFLNSARMLEIIADLKSRYDWVFFDSPPILGVSDAAVLARELDCTAMVVQHRRYPLNISLRVKQAVLDVGGNLLGVVMNQVDTTEDATYGYYNSYYTYYNEKGNKVRRKRKQDAAGGPARGKQAPSTVHRNGDAEDY
jgi:capsular exopolysaccharide synthesis family protein